MSQLVLIIIAFSLMSFLLGLIVGTMLNTQFQDRKSKYRLGTILLYSNSNETLKDKVCVKWDDGSPVEWYGTNEIFDANTNRPLSYKRKLVGTQVKLKG